MTKPTEPTREFMTNIYDIEEALNDLYISLTLCHTDDLIARFNEFTYKQQNGGLSFYDELTYHLLDKELMTRPKFLRFVADTQGKRRAKLNLPD